MVGLSEQLFTDPRSLQSSLFKKEHVYKYTWTCQILEPSKWLGWSPLAWYIGIYNECKVWTAINILYFFPSYHRQMNMGLHGSWPFHRVHAAPPNNHRNLESFGLSKEVFLNQDQKLSWGGEIRICHKISIKGMWSTKCIPNQHFNSPTNIISYNKQEQIHKQLKFYILILNE